MSGTRQDNKIEKKQIKFFKAQPGPGRSNKYVHDATKTINEKVYRAEFKSTSQDRGMFSTSSRMGVMKVEAWKKGFEFMLCSIFDDAYEFIGHYVGFQEHLEPFYQKVIDKQNKGHAGRAGMNLWRKAENDLKSLGYTEKELKSLHKQNLFGSRINDPGISLKEVEEWGWIKLDDKDPNNHLEAILRSRNG
jgi:hypothetical protein